MPSKNGYDVEGTNDDALFTLRIHRGDGMALLAMNWKDGKKPPKSFVGFAIEYKEPGGDRFYPLQNRLAFTSERNPSDPTQLSTRRSPIQKFRWVHFPRNADMDGDFIYQVTPVFMNDKDELSFGEAQTVGIELRRETYPKKLNVTFTRGFVSSQSFVDKFLPKGTSMSTLLPAKADEGLDFEPTHPKTDEALAWMGFEARSAILELLDQAIADSKAEVRVVAYDLNEPDIVSRLKKLKKRLKIIIDDSAAHGDDDSAESEAARQLEKSAGAANVKRQHLRKLQHNKTIAVRGPKIKAAVAGSTNFTWRGLFVQSNNALIVRGDTATQLFFDAFDDYWAVKKGVGEFGGSASATWNDLGLAGIDAKIAFSPHSEDNALLEEIAKDTAKTTSSLFFSLAFLYQTKGPVRDAIIKVRKTKFTYGISENKTDGLDVQLPNGNPPQTYPSALLKKTAPAPFKPEPTGGSGIRLHHKFVVIDFDKPTGRVYLGSYNFSRAADVDNGENLLLIRDRRIAVSYMVEAVRIFDHYQFRALQNEKPKKELVLKKPPREPNEEAWWEEDWTDKRKKADRLLFA